MVLRWDYKRSKLGFEVEYQGEDLVLEKEGTFVFGQKACLWLLITLWVSLQIWCVELTNFTALQIFQERTVFKYKNMGFARGDRRKFEETDLTTFTYTCIGANLTFTGTGLNDMTELQISWWLGCIETLKTRSGTKDLGEMCIWLGTNFPHKTPATTRKILLEKLGRYLDERLTLSDKELQAKAYRGDKGTEEHDLEELRKDNGGKLALFNSNDTAVLWDLSNWILLLCLMLSKLLIKLNIDSANLRLPFFTKFTLSK